MQAQHRHMQSKNAHLGPKVASHFSSCNSACTMRFLRCSAFLAVGRILATALCLVRILCLTPFSYHHLSLLFLFSFSIFFSPLLSFISNSALLAVAHTGLSHYTRNLPRTLVDETCVPHMPQLDQHYPLPPEPGRVTSVFFPPNPPLPTWDVASS
ncbi:hypothetical protein BGZ63DRAFT_229587 [Mariannaea sp. PMI_226]|nr:hypothetical protein BGZ63DRAFT_229587 [Mariannaea sp. PMI_226]